LHYGFRHGTEHSAFDTGPPVGPKANRVCSHPFCSRADGTRNVLLTDDLGARDETLSELRYEPAKLGDDVDVFQILPTVVP
jgi:hypothetical protein